MSIVRGSVEDLARARRCWTLAAIATAVVAAVVATWPLATALGQAVPTAQWHCLGRGCEDEFLCVWIVTSLGKRLIHAPLTLFEGGILLPLRHTLAYSETMLSAVALTAPITWLTGNHVLAYDLYYLATVALSVLGTFLLVRDVTGDPRAALVAGLLFGLAGERWRDRGHLAKVSVQWAPFVCWMWIRFLDRPGVSRGLALAAATVANLHAGIYQGLLLPLLLGPWAAVLMCTRLWPLRRWAASGVALASALAAGLVFFWPFVVVREELSFTSTGMAEVPQGWAWYLGALGHPIAYLQRFASPDRGIAAMSPLPLLGLVAAGLAAVVRRPGTPAPPGQRAHLAAALAFMLMGAAVTVRSDRLGPLGPLMDALFALPGLDGLRGRSRLAVLVTFGGAVTLGIALAAVLRRLRRGVSSALVTCIAAIAVVIDTRTLYEAQPLTWLPRAADLPPALAQAIRTDPKGGLLHLPYGNWAMETLYMMWSLHHDRPLMNGYTAVMPRFSPIVNELPSATARRALAEAGVTHVILHTSLMEDVFGRAQVQRVLDAPDLQKVTLGDGILLTVDPAPEARPPLEGAPIPSRDWHIEGSDPDAAAAIDGDLRTHWTARTIDRATFLRVDLGVEHRVTGMRLRLGPHIREYPNVWEAWGSRDGSNWKRLGGERPTPPPFASYRRDHRAVEVDLPLQEASVRLLELRVPPEKPVVVFTAHGKGTWGVHELMVLGP